MYKNLLLTFFIDSVVHINHHTLCVHIRKQYEYLDIYSRHVKWFTFSREESQDQEVLRPLFRSNLYVLYITLFLRTLPIFSHLFLPLLAVYHCGLSIDTFLSPFLLSNPSCWESDVVARFLPSRPVCPPEVCFERKTFLRGRDNGDDMGQWPSVSILTLPSVSLRRRRRQSVGTRVSSKRIFSRLSVQMDWRCMESFQYFFF